MPQTSRFCSSGKRYQEYTFGFGNANGTLRTLAITDGFNSGGTQTCNYGTSSTPGYVELGRLVNVNCPSVWSQSFSYDPFDNITKTGSITWQLGYNQANNRYLPGTTNYDSNGNVGKPICSSPMTRVTICPGTSFCEGSDSDRKLENPCQVPSARYFSPIPSSRTGNFVGAHVPFSPRQRSYW